MPSVPGPASARSPSRAGSAALVAACAIALACGAWLRFDGLERKPAWHDEVGTALRISGRREAELRALYDGSAHQAGEIVAAFQGVGGEPRSASEVVAATLEDEPQGGALYFPLLHLWARAAGDGAARLRALSACASLAAVGLVGLLARALFDERRTALLAAAFAAVSPFHLRYAQEARSYALWSAAVALATLLLARALRGGRARAWIGYGASAAVLLLLQPLSVTVLAAHGIAALPAARARRGVGLRFAGAVVFALACAAPWAAAAARRRAVLEQTLAWTAASPTPLERARGLAWLVSGLFFRTGAYGGLLGDPAEASGGATALRAAFLGGLFALVGAAILALARAAWRARPSRDAAGASPDPRPEAALLALALFAVPFAALAVLDLLLGGRRASVDRYLVPSWLGLELAVAWYLTEGGARAWRTAAAIALLGLGVATGIGTRPQPVWWNTNAAALLDRTGVAAVVRATPGAVVLSDAAPVDLLELLRALDPATPVRLGEAAATALPADRWRDALLVGASPALRAAAARAAGRPAELVRRGVELDAWRIAPAAQPARAP